MRTARRWQRELLAVQHSDFNGCDSLNEARKDPNWLIHLVEAQHRIALGRKILKFWEKKRNSAGGEESEEMESDEGESGLSHVTLNVEGNNNEGGEGGDGVTYLFQEEEEEEDGSVVMEEGEEGSDVIMSDQQHASFGADSVGDPFLSQAGSGRDEKEENWWYETPPASPAPCSRNNRRDEIPALGHSDTDEATALDDKENPSVEVSSFCFIYHSICTHLTVFYCPARVCLQTAATKPDEKTEDEGKIVTDSLSKSEETLEGTLDLGLVSGDKTNKREDAHESGASFRRNRPGGDSVSCWSVRCIVISLFICAHSFSVLVTQLPFPPAPRNNRNMSYSAVDEMNNLRRRLNTVTTECDLAKRKLKEKDAIINDLRGDMMELEDQMEKEEEANFGFVNMVQRLNLEVKKLREILSGRVNGEPTSSVADLPAQATKTGAGADLKPQGDDGFADTTGHAAEVRQSSLKIHVSLLCTHSFDIDVELLEC